MASQLGKLGMHNCHYQHSNRAHSAVAALLLRYEMKRKAWWEVGVVVAKVVFAVGVGNYPMSASNPNAFKTRVVLVAAQLMVDDLDNGSR